jgi:hypothetical protein
MSMVLRDWFTVCSQRGGEVLAFKMNVQKVLNKTIDEKALLDNCSEAVFLVVCDPSEN